MQITLENRKKVVVNSLKNVFKRNNKVEERGVLGSRVKKEQENTNVRAQKMMRDNVEPYVVPTMVQAMPTVVQAIRQTTKIPQMTFPQERQPKEHKQEVPYIKFPQERQLKE